MQARPGGAGGAPWACWAGLALTLAVLVGLHARLDAMLDPGGFHILDPEAFGVGHPWYFHLSTVQWLCAVSYGVLSVWVRREEERGAGPAEGDAAERSWLGGGLSGGGE